MWKWLDQYFTFSVNDRRAIVALVTLVALTLAFPLLSDLLMPIGQPALLTSKEEFRSFIAAYEQSARETEEDTSGLSDEASNPFAGQAIQKRFITSPSKPVLFRFNPNFIGTEDWMRLGFSRKQAEVIERYKSKGGRFRKPADLSRLSVVSAADYQRLLPYIALPAETSYHVFRRDTFNSGTREPRMYTVDISSADSATFERQRGIGPALARRIVNYRSRLGGFVSIDQVGEVWGMPDSTFQKLRPALRLGSPEIKKININTSDAEVMRVHPYINYSLARLLVRYRQQHGPYGSADDIRKIMVITDSLFYKLRPYIAVD